MVSGTGCQQCSEIVVCRFYVQLLLVVTFLYSVSCQCVIVGLTAEKYTAESVSSAGEIQRDTSLLSSESSVENLVSEVSPLNSDPDMNMRNSGDFPAY